MIFFFFFATWTNCEHDTDILSSYKMQFLIYTLSSYGATLTSIWSCVSGHRANISPVFNCAISPFDAGQVNTVCLSNFFLPKTAVCEYNRKHETRYDGATGFARRAVCHSSSIRSRANRAEAPHYNQVEKMNQHRVCGLYSLVIKTSSDL